MPFWPEVRTKVSTDKALTRHLKRHRRYHRCSKSQNFRSIHEQADRPCLLCPPYRLRTRGVTDVKAF